MASLKKENNKSILTSQNTLINGKYIYSKNIFILKHKRLDYLNSTFKSYITYQPFFEGGQCHHEFLSFNFLTLFWETNGKILLQIKNQNNTCKRGTHLARCA